MKEKTIRGGVGRRHEMMVILGLVTTAALSAGVVAPASAATTNVNVNDAETIVLHATNEGAFNGKTDTLQAIELGEYLSAESEDGGRTLSAIGVQTKDAYKQAVIDALKAAGIDSIDTTNPVYTAMQMAGDTGEENPPYSSAVREFATSLNTQPAITGATGVKGTISDNGKTLTFSNLDEGWYIIRDTTPKGKTAAIPMLVGTEAGGLDFANNDLGTINYKSLTDNSGGNGDGKENVTPPVKSTDGAGSAAHKVGDTVTYTVKQKVPNTTGYPGFRLNITDTLGAGLDYKANSYKITVGGKNLDAKYVKFTQSGRTLSWDFGLDTTVEGSTKVRNILEGEAASVFTPGSEITLSYSVTINSDAVDDGANLNSVKTSYSNNPNAWWGQLGMVMGETPDGDGPVEIMLGEATVETTRNDKTTALPNVTVQVGEWAGEGEFVPLNFVKNEDGTFTLADSDDSSTVTDLTSDSNGEITINGINGDYEVKQIGAAEGWSNTYLADFKFTSVPGHGEGNDKATLDTSHNQNNLAFQIDAATIGLMSVQNSSQLPQTGMSMGAIMMTVTAVAALGGITLAFTARQRKTF